VNKIIHPQIPGIEFLALILIMSCNRFIGEILVVIVALEKPAVSAIY